MESFENVISQKFLEDLHKALEEFYARLKPVFNALGQVAIEYVNHASPILAEMAKWIEVYNYTPRRPYQHNYIGIRPRTNFRK